MYIYTYIYIYICIYVHIHMLIRVMCSMDISTYKYHIYTSRTAIICIYTHAGWYTYMMDDIHWFMITLSNSLNNLCINQSSKHVLIDLYNIPESGLVECAGRLSKHTSTSLSTTFTSESFWRGATYLFGSNARESACHGDQGLRMICPPTTFVCHTLW